MRGAVFLGNRKIEIRSFPDPTPGPGEVVLRMRASGMCGSDLKFYRSAPGEAQKALGLGGDAEPFIAGHEPCGEVVARGPGVPEREAPTGQRVMDHHYAGCGVCKHCRLGWSQLCRAGITVYGVTAHGGHAEYLRVPVRTIVPLPEELSFAEGAAVACGTGTAYGALRRMNLAALRSRCSGRARWASARRSSARRWARASSRSKPTPSAWRSPSSTALTHWWTHQRATSKRR
jgi:D-arabinose 1-dehydrogenase-like Zn-dependent alcohol dehydrogenase